MKKQKLLYLLIILSFGHFTLSSQLPLHGWRDHLPYNQAKNISVLNNQVYVATEGGAIFFLNKADNTLNKLSKANGLSDIGISTMKYDNYSNNLLIAYANANIDILKNNQIINIPDIKNKAIYGNKTIYNIHFNGDYAYLACGFGIVVIDLSNYTVKEQFIIGGNGDPVAVYDVLFFNNKLYAATEQGLLSADPLIEPLVDFNSWKKDLTLPNPTTSCNFIANYNDKLYVVKSQTLGPDKIYIFENDAWTEFESGLYTDINLFKVIDDKLIILAYQKYTLYKNNLIFKNYDAAYNLQSIYPENDHLLWLADKYGGLIKDDNGVLSFYSPNGPRSINATSIACAKDAVWVGGGSLNLISQFNNGEGAYSFINESWSSYLYATDIPPNIYKVIVDPNDYTRVFMGSSGAGLVEFRNNKYYKTYDTTNSALISTFPGMNSFIRVLGLAFDNSNNLWMTTSEATTPLYMYSNTGKFYAYKPINILDFKVQQEVYDIVVTNTTQLKWISTPKKHMKGIYIYDDHNTPENTSDDNDALLNIINQDGEAMENFNCMVKDKNGYIWIGTSTGPIVYYNPDEIMNNLSIAGTQIKISRTDNSGSADYLLKTEKINCIAIDGADRKWFGTEKSGAYLISADGTTELQHFTTDNSPIFSDNILSIGINDKSGEIFFGTEKGIVSYKGDATEADDNFKDVYVYPNPVREDYYGDIVITGLIRAANVKITDINGNLVYETTSLGGQAIWNGKNFGGRRVNTGVYLVFCTNDDGSKTFITKILFIH